MRLPIFLLLLASGVASAERDAFDQLQKAVPSGWTVLETEHELVIRHDRPCFAMGSNRPGEAPSAGNPCSTADGPLVTFELRFHTEPRWSKKQLDEARATNERIAEELKRTRERFRVDQIRQSKGRPLPTTPDEQHRLAAYETAEAQLHARQVRMPMCVLGEYSVFDSDDIYAVLKLKVDPPSAMTEAHRALEALKKQCGAL